MKRLTTLFAFFVFVGFQLLQAQDVQITGNVTNADDGSALPGVSIVVKGTTIGTVTDYDGNYVLAVPESAATLVFSYIGMLTQEVAVDNQSTIDVVLQPDVVGLDEVVVTAIGIKREAKALGYAVTEVSNDDIQNSNQANIINSISGKVAGVSVNNSSGALGGSSYITIRGAASLTRDNRPLFVVDGVPIDAGGGTFGVAGVALSDRASDLNPDDIASISILKGGAATALYGLRAANGAVVITTKSGTAGTQGVKVDFNSSVEIQQISQVPDLQTSFGAGYSEEFAHAGGSQAWWAQAYSWGPPISELGYTTDPAYATDMAEYMEKWDPNGMVVSRYTAQEDDHMVATREAILDAGLTPIDNPWYSASNPVQTYDHYDFFQTGTVFNNTLSISGGGDETNYYFSVGNQTGEGVVPNNKYRKNSFKLRAESKLTSKITTEASVNFINTGGDRIQQGSNTSGVMLGLLRTVPNFDNSYGYQFPDGRQRNYRGGGGYDNPYWVSNNILYTDDVNRLIGHVGFNWFATEWLNVSYKLGTDWYSRRWKDTFEKGSRTNVQGRSATGQQFNRDINSDLLLNINRDLGESLRLSVTLGNNLYIGYYNTASGTANSIDIPGFYDLSNTADISADEYLWEKRTAAFFGDVGLAFQSMLYLSVTGRQEWSTTLPAENNAFFYPSASLGFVFTELPMLSGNNILPFGKVRVSYAVTASDAGAHNTTTTWFKAGPGDGWTSGITFPFGGQNGMSYANTPGNTELLPEKMITFEVGADLRFYNNRFGLDFTYFSNTNEDLLLSVPISRASGFYSLYQNAGKMSSKGIEALVTVVPVQTSDFKWGITANFTMFDNIVEELAPGIENLGLGGFTSAQIRAVADEPYRSLYTEVFERDDDGNLLIVADPGAWNYGFPQASSDFESVGTVNPDWTAGITNSLQYKGFGLSALIDIRQGGKMWNGTKGALKFFGKLTEQNKRQWVANPDGTVDVSQTPAENLYVFEGVKATTDVDGNLVSTGETNDINVVRGQNWYIDGEGSGFTGPGEFNVEDANWVRLREVTLSYAFPSAMLGNIFLDRVELFATGKNLWISTPYSGIDPETSLLGASNGQGLDYFNMPGVKSYVFGLRVSF